MYFHLVALRVFCREGEPEHSILSSLKWLAAVDFENEKLLVEKKLARGFNQRRIIIISLVMKKQHYINAFCNALLERLNGKEGHILRQLDSRLDGNLNLFIRFDKRGVLERRLELTDTGDCYHLRLKVAAFPKRKDIAIGLLRYFFNQKTKII